MIVETPFPHLIFKNAIDISMLSRIKQEFEYAKHGDYYVNADCCELNSYLQNYAWENLYLQRKELEKITKNIKNNLPCNKNDSFFRIMIKVMDPGTIHHSIHCDADWKQLTTIIYISDNNTGTKFYKTRQSDSFDKEVEWEINKGYSFIPSLHSWHNFENDLKFKEKRIVLMLTLCNKTYYR
jgi:hypothetical protein